MRKIILASLLALSVIPAAHAEPEPDYDRSACFFGFLAASQLLELKSEMGSALRMRGRAKTIARGHSHRIILTKEYVNETVDKFEKMTSEQFIDFLTACNEAY